MRVGGNEIVDSCNIRGELQNVSFLNERLAVCCSSNICGFDYISFQELEKIARNCKYFSKKI